MSIITCDQITPFILVVKRKAFAVWFKSNRGCFWLHRPFILIHPSFSLSFIFSYCLNFLSLFFLNFNVLFMFFCSSFSLCTSFCCLWNFSSFSYWFSHSLHLLLSLLYQCSYPLILPLTSSFLLIFSLSIFAYLCPGSRRKCIKKSKKYG